MVIFWDSSAPDAPFYKGTQLAWGAGYCLLLCLSIGLAIVAIRQARKLELPHETFVRLVLQLLLGCGGLLSLVIYTKSTSGLFSSFGARYLCTLWISTPAVLWPLWKGVFRIQRFSRIYYIFTAFRISIIFMIFMGFIVSMSYIFSEIPNVQKENHSRALLIQKLQEMHITRFYSEYWTCARLIFVSQEKLICGATEENLTHAFDRYMPYRTAVMAIRNPAFVFPVGFPGLTNLEHALIKTHTPYRHIVYEGYIIVQPEHPIAGVPLYRL
jgi:hypothetical protein